MSEKGLEVRKRVRVRRRASFNKGLRDVLLVSSHSKGFITGCEIKSIFI